MLRVFHHYVSGRKLRFFLAETLSVWAAGLAGAGALVLWMSPAWGTALQEGTVHRLGLLALGLAAFFQLAFYAADLYDLRIASSDAGAGGARLLRTGGAVAFALGLGGLALGVREPPGALMGGVLGALAGAILVRVLLRRLDRPSRVLLVGGGVKARALAAAIRGGGEGAFTVCGMVEPPEEGAPDGQGERGVDALAIAYRATYVVVALEGPGEAHCADALVRCRLAGVHVLDAAGFCERVLRRLPVAHLRATDLAFEERMTPSAARLASKRVFDLLVSSALLLLAALPALVVAVAVKLDSPGPVLYSQERVGKGGRAYRLWKFRSMRTDAERDGAAWARKDDDRVTRVGHIIRKMRLDELPQLVNVLRGEMSLVGPRPERPIFVDQLCRQIPFYRVREVVKPGITGWAQIRYPYGASVEDARNKLELDLYYVKNGSLFLDLAIVFHTVRHVLLRRGAR